MKEMNNNIYKLGYELLSSALEEDNPNLGIAKALDLLKKYFKCQDILIYDVNSDEFVNQSFYQIDKYDFLLNFINNNKDKFKYKPIYEIYIDNEFMKDLTYFNIDNNNYALIVINKNLNSDLSNDANLEIIKKSLTIILKKEKLYENLIKSCIIDGLTGLENRLSFNRKVEEYNNDDKKIIFVLLDLFRLKYVNDNFGHIIGDLYIKCTSGILKKYFPKYIYNTLTGDNIYRIGGDEFVVMSEDKSLEQIQSILELAAEEVQNLDLGIGENVPIGINFGIAERISNEPIEELYKKADVSLSQDKRKMYEKLNINRRK